MTASASRLGERDDRDECELDRPPAQGGSGARIAAPESSPFAMKPLAPLSAIRPP